MSTEGVSEGPDSVKNWSYLKVVLMVSAIGACRQTHTVRNIACGYASESHCRIVSTTPLTCSQVRISESEA